MTAAAKKRYRVLIVDDSALARKILREGIGKCPDLEVVGVAGDPYRARDLLVELKPDVMTLDVEMPRMDGVTFLKQFMPVQPTPTVMISSFTQAGQKITLEALEAGAVDFVPKPTTGLVDGLPGMLDEICRRVKAAATVNVSRFAQVARPSQIAPVESVADASERILTIGASTGGVGALASILPAFPADAPGMVFLVHMPAGFTHSFAQRLNGQCRMRVKEAENGDRVEPGLALLAPGGTQHTTLTRSRGEYRVKLIAGEEVNYSRPAVDVLFKSVAMVAGRNTSAALLTGMGRDGAAGMLAIRLAGGRTVAQDKETCVVFGMPAAAQEMGAAEFVAPLDRIPNLMMGAFKKR